MTEEKSINIHLCIYTVNEEFKKVNLYSEIKSTLKEIGKTKGRKEFRDIYKGLKTQLADLKIESRKNKIAIINKNSKKFGVSTEKINQVLYGAYSDNVSNIFDDEDL